MMSWGPQNSRIVFFVSMSTTRIDMSSQENATRPLDAWYLQDVGKVIGAQSICSRRPPVRKSQNLIFPSNEQETMVLFMESTIIPVIALVCLPVPIGYFR